MEDDLRAVEDEPCDDEPDDERDVDGFAEAGAGARGVGSRDSLGCQVTPMRTLAVDPSIIPRRSIVFIAETVGLILPDGSKHDGLWYASDIGGAIKGSKVDLYTGSGAASMKQFFEKKLNTAVLNAVKVGTFTGCPPK